MGKRRPQVGIPEAIDATGRTFTVTQIVPLHHDAPYQRPLHCGQCEVGVVAVNGYVNRNGNQVVAHFRLAKDECHLVGCAFDFAAQSLIVSRRHPAVVNSTRDGFELSLDALMCATTARHETARATGTKSVGAGLQMRNAERSIVDVVSLLERYAFDPQSQLAFSAAFRGQHLSWREFCFEAATEIKRFQRAVHDDDSVPRLLVGVVSCIRPSNAGDTMAAEIQVRRHCADAQRPVFSDTGRPILPVLRAAGRDGFDFAEGDRVAAFGKWHLFGQLEQPTLWLGRTGNAIAL